MSGVRTVNQGTYLATTNAYTASSNTKPITAKIGLSHPIPAAVGLIQAAIPLEITHRAFRIGGNAMAAIQPANMIIKPSVDG